MVNVDFVLFLVLFIWFPLEYVVGDVIPNRRRRGAKIRFMDGGSKLLVYATIYPALAIAFVLAAFNIAMLPGWVFYPGVVIMVLGILFRLWAILVLGRYFSESVGVQEGQKVVDTGPYRYIRHPAYTGGLFAFLGCGLALQSWGAILLLLLSLAITYGYRIPVEEKVLASQLGDEYVRYMKRTKGLIPFLL